MEWQLWFLQAADAVRPATTGVHCVPQTMGQDKLFLPDRQSHKEEEWLQLGLYSRLPGKGRKSHRHFFLVSSEVPWTTPTPNYYWLLPLFLVTLQNLTEYPIAKDTTHLCHRIWRNQVGNELEEVSSLLASFLSA